ncbi:MAG: hypothetical protein ACRDT1_11720 [Micromonosporaceae bacterium]
MLKYVGIYTVLTRPDLTDPTRWLTPVTEAFRDRPVGPLPVPHSNAMRTLRCLYLFLDRGARLSAEGPVIPVPHRDMAREVIAQTPAVR